MRSKKQVEEEILELQIEHAFLTSVELDGRNQQQAIGEYDKYKADDIKLIKKLKRKEKFTSRISSLQKRVPQICTALFLVLLISVSMLFSSETAMAKVMQILYERNDVSIEVDTPLENGEITDLLSQGSFVATYIPDGYLQYENVIYQQVQTISSSNKDGEIITVRIYLNSTLSSYDSEQVDVIESFFLDDIEYLYIRNEEKGYDSMISVNNGVKISIDAVLLGKDELTKIVQGINFIEY